MSTATTTAPRKLHQVLVWLIAALALVGVGFLASGGATSGTGTDAFTSAASTTSTSTVAQPTTASQPVDFYAGPQLEVSEEESGEPGQCEAGSADDSYLPALRWTDFGLSPERGFEP